MKHPKLELPTASELRAIGLQPIAATAALEEQNKRLNASLSSCRSQLWAEVHRSAGAQRTIDALRKDNEEMRRLLSESARCGPTLRAFPSTGAEPGGATVVIAQPPNQDQPPSPIASPLSPLFNFEVDDDFLNQVMAPSAMFMGMERL